MQYICFFAVTVDVLHFIQMNPRVSTLSAAEPSGYISTSGSPATGHDGFFVFFVFICFQADGIQVTSCCYVPLMQPFQFKFNKIKPLALEAPK